MNQLPTRDVLRQHLQKMYKGVFSDTAIEAHIDNYIGFTYAEFLVDRITPYLDKNSKILDIGCGYGAFVARLREKGYQSFGIDIGEFEINYAKSRIDAQDVFKNASALSIPFPDASFDIVTLWNVLEHMSDYKAALKEATRVLKPNGRLFIECPNYAAFRQEAHYHVPWYPLMPRKFASRYLKKKGKDPSFFENHIFYCTQWGILRTLSRLKLKSYFYSVENIKKRRLSKIFPFIPKLASLKYYNPLIASSEIMAVRHE